MARTGRSKPIAWPSLVGAIAAGALAWLLAGAPVTSASPRAGARAAVHAAGRVAAGRVAAGHAAGRVAAVHAARSPLSSRLLWATVDVCNPHDQPYTVGVRGSMPGDDSSKDTLYMRFRIQYLQASDKRWIYIAHGADSGWLKLGSADVSRQAGRSFQFAHGSGAPAFTLRGVVAFQWKHDSTVVLSTYRVTSAGHKSVAGSDPKGYSAATCSLS